MILRKMTLFMSSICWVQSSSMVKFVILKHLERNFSNKVKIFSKSPMIRTNFCSTNIFESVFRSKKLLGKKKNFIEKLIFNSYRARISNSHKYKYLNCVQLRGHFPISKETMEEMKKKSFPFILLSFYRNIVFLPLATWHIKAVMKNSIEFQFSFRETMFYVSWRF